MTGNADRPFASLFSDLTRNLTGLIKDEIELAKIEFGHKLSVLGMGVASLAVGGAVLYAGFLVLLAALCIGLGEILAVWHVQPWVSPLIVGLIVAGSGYLLVRKGRANLATNDLMPNRTLQSIKDDVSHEKAALSRTRHGERT